MSVDAAVLSRVKQTVVRSLELDVDPSELADDEPLIGGGLGIDSVTSLTLVCAVEEEFGIEVDDEDLRVELFDSVASLSAYVARRLQECSGHAPA